VRISPISTISKQQNGVKEELRIDSQVWIEPVIAWTS
jgi:hypothetical protein